jgi:hypothetical protein
MPAVLRRAAAMRLILNVAVCAASSRESIVASLQ